MCTLAAGWLVAALALAAVRSMRALLPRWLHLAGHGLHQPCWQAALPAPFPAHAGAASALSGRVPAPPAFGIGRRLEGTWHGGVPPPA